MTKLKVENANYHVFLDRMMTSVQDSLACLFENKEDGKPSYPEVQSVILLRMPAHPANDYRMKINHPSTNSDNLIRFSPLII